ncbi:MAG TPA: fasciclin domain-containing protein [Pirellulales bacterium]
MLRYSASARAAAAMLALSLSAGSANALQAQQDDPQSAPRATQAEPRNRPAQDRNEVTPDRRDNRAVPPAADEPRRVRNAAPPAEVQNEAAPGRVVREAEKRDIVAVLNQGEKVDQKNNFTAFAKAVKAAGLDETLRGDGPFTVFAPTDEAFARLPEGRLDELLKDREGLKALLLGHVIQGSKVLAAQAGDVADAHSVSGGAITVVADGGKVVVNDANVVRPDIAASNGVIHGIDRILDVKSKDANATDEVRKPAPTSGANIKVNPTTRPVNEEAIRRDERVREERREERAEERQERREERAPAAPAAPR